MAPVTSDRTGFPAKENDRGSRSALNVRARPSPNEVHSMPVSSRIGRLSQRIVSSSAALRLHGAKLRITGSHMKKFAVRRRNRSTPRGLTGTPVASPMSSAAAAIV